MAQPAGAGLSLEQDYGGDEEAMYKSDAFRMSCMKVRAFGGALEAGGAREARCIPPPAARPRPGPSRPPISLGARRRMPQSALAAACRPASGVSWSGTARVQDCLRRSASVPPSPTQGFLHRAATRRCSHAPSGLCTTGQSARECRTGGGAAAGLGAAGAPLPCPSGSPPAPHHCQQQQRHSRAPPLSPASCPSYPQLCAPAREGAPPRPPCPQLHRHRLPLHEEGGCCQVAAGGGA